jgi:hypothetical protein
MPLEVPTLESYWAASRQGTYLMLFFLSVMIPTDAGLEVFQTSSPLKPLEPPPLTPASASTNIVLTY